MATFCKELVSGLVEEAMKPAKEIAGNTVSSEEEEDKDKAEENGNMEIGEDMEGILEQGTVEGDDTLELESNEEEDAIAVEAKHFKTRYNVQGHFKYGHTPVTDRKFICGTCPGRFVTPSDRDRHSETCRGPGVRRQGRRVERKSNTPAARVNQAVHHSRRNVPHPTTIRGWRLSNDQLLTEPFVKLQLLGKLQPEDKEELTKLGCFDLYA